MNTLKEITTIFHQLKCQWKTDISNVPDKLDNPVFKPAKISPNVAKYLKIIPNSNIAYVELYFKLFIHLIKNGLMNNNGIIVKDIPDINVKSGELFVDILGKITS
jgi:hypothetical protein